MKKIENRNEFANQVMIVIDKLLPTGICVYGPVVNEIFDIAKLYDIPIYQYDSYTMKENFKDKAKLFSEVNHI